MERIMAVSGQWTGRARSNPPRNHIAYLADMVGRGKIVDVVPTIAQPEAPITVSLKPEKPPKTAKPAQAPAPVPVQVVAAVAQVAANTDDAVASIEANIKALRATRTGPGRPSNEFKTKLAELEKQLAAAKAGQTIVKEVVQEAKKEEKKQKIQTGGKAGRSSKKPAAVVQEETATAIATVQEAVEAANVVQTIAEEVADEAEKIAQEEGIAVPVVDSVPEPAPPVVIPAPDAAAAVDPLLEALQAANAPVVDPLLEALQAANAPAAAVGTQPRRKKSAAERIAGLIQANGQRRYAHGSRRNPPLVINEKVLAVIRDELMAQQRATPDEAKEAANEIAKAVSLITGDPSLEDVVKKIRSLYAQIMDIIRDTDEDEDEGPVPVAPAPTRPAQPTFTEEEADAEIKRRIVAKIAEMLGTSQVKANRRRR
jgi:hypothetical protein